MSRVTTPLDTPLTRLLAIRVPIVQAPIGACATPELAAAVSNAGGLGMLALSWTPAERIEGLIERTRKLTAGPLGANLVLQWEQHERLVACLEAGVEVISFSWGDPEPYLPLLKAAEVRTMLTVGSAAEAKRAVELGIDVVVAQGLDAGGHVWGKVGTMALVPAVVDVVDGRAPVVAAGGIADGRGLAAALMLGASGVWLGTRFVASKESAAHPGYQGAIVGAPETDTLLTELFDGGRPATPHRVLTNSTTRAWQAAGSPPRGHRPGEGGLLGRSPSGQDIHRYDDAVPLAGMTGDWEAFALYAGQSAGLVRDVQPAGEIIRRMVEDARSVMARWANA
jgi:nitronate monooxygenase